MRQIATALIALVGVINLLPVVGVLGSARLQSLYGIDVIEPNLLILLRHRAVLFGLIGGFLLCAAWRPQWRATATALAALSMAAFVVVASIGGGECNEQIKRIVLIDIAALVMLAASAALHSVSVRNQQRRARLGRAEQNPRR